jgi:hypothetical protein
LASQHSAVAGPFLSVANVPSEFCSRFVPAVVGPTHLPVLAHIRKIFTLMDNWPAAGRWRRNGKWDVESRTSEVDTDLPEEGKSSKGG